MGHNCQMNPEVIVEGDARRLYDILSTQHSARVVLEIVATAGGVPMVKFHDPPCAHTWGESGSEGFLLSYDSRTGSEVTLTFKTSAGDLVVESEGTTVEWEGSPDNDEVTGTLGSYAVAWVRVWLNDEPVMANGRSKILIVTKPDLEGPMDDALGGL